MNGCFDVRIEYNNCTYYQLFKLSQIIKTKWTKLSFSMNRFCYLKIIYMYYRLLSVHIVQYKEIFFHKSLPESFLYVMVFGDTNLCSDEFDLKSYIDMKVSFWDGAVRLKIVFRTTYIVHLITWGLWI